MKHTGQKNKRQGHRGGQLVVKSFSAGIRDFEPIFLEDGVVELDTGRHIDRETFENAISIMAGVASLGLRCGMPTSQIRSLCGVTELEVTDGNIVFSVSPRFLRLQTGLVPELGQDEKDSVLEDSMDAQGMLWLMEHKDEINRLHGLMA